MRYYKKISIRENKRRVSLLVEFRNQVVDYFNDITSFTTFRTIEGKTAEKLRIKINRNLRNIYSILLAVGVSPLVGDIDILQNIFLIPKLPLVEPQRLLDHIERAIGVYEHDQKKATWRTINPLFWLGLLLDYFVNLPFKVIGRFGFDQMKVETSILGRIIKGVGWLFTRLAAFLTVLQLIGYLEKFKSLFVTIKTLIK